MFPAAAPANGASRAGARYFSNQSNHQIYVSRLTRP